MARTQTGLGSPAQRAERRSLTIAIAIELKAVISDIGDEVNLLLRGHRLENFKAVLYHASRFERLLRNHESTGVDLRIAFSATRFVGLIVDEQYVNCCGFGSAHGR